MTDPFFFGYGSLVNRATHSYAEAYPARLRGWRRAWKTTPHHPVSLLTAVPDATSEIEGLIAHVPNGDWAALDERETGYNRHPATPEIAHSVPRPISIQVYAVPAFSWLSTQGGIRLSYLDVVVQGYLREFGETGVEKFFETTDGWETPIINDRNTPIYPRHQVLTPEETRLVDDWVAKVQS